jgi:glycolate oxidase FAD binding subunit
MSVAALASALGVEKVILHEPMVMEGAKLEATLRPESGEALAEALRALSAAQIPALLRGGGSRLATANGPCRARALLDTSALGFEPELDAEEGVMRCSAGSRLAALRERLAGSGWELPLDPPGPGATLGGTLAAAAVGPCYATPRDNVLGLGVVLADGERVRCGGRVVKNVTGYDLAKLFVGSFGSYGVIEWAWLRLRPAPEATRVMVASGEIEWARVLEAARRPSVRAAALADAGLVSGESVARCLVLELAGDAAAVAADAAWLEAECDAREGDAAVLEEVRAAQGAGPLRIRIAALPSGLPAAADVLREAGAQLISHPARGLVWARFPLSGPEDEAGVDGALAAATRAAARASGSRRIEQAPFGARVGREVFGGADASLSLERALKEQYDPEGILNPGRFVGGL